MNNHYIYTLTDPDDGTTKYVGQGRHYRYTDWLNAKPSWEFKYGVYPWLWSLKKNGKKPIINKVLEGLSQKQVDAWEIGLIDFVGRVIKGTGPLLNIADGGVGGRGVVKSVETRRKLSEANKGKTLSVAHRRKIGKGNKGKVRSKETRDRISKSLAGREGHPVSLEAKQKISKANKGRPSPNKGKKTGPLSEAHCRALSESHKGKPSPKKGIPLSADHRQKISKAKKGKAAHNKGKPSPLKGIPKSAEAIRKMSATKRRKNLIRRIWRAVFDAAEQAQNA